MAQRVLRGVAASLSFTNVDQNGTPVAAAGAVTAGVTRADGTEVLAAGSATTSGGTGVYLRALTAAQTALLGQLTATWTDAGDSSTHTTTVEVVGGYYFSLAEARAADTTLADDTRYPDATVLRFRQQVEVECEEICGQAFVPRYRRVRVDGNGSNGLLLPDPRARAVRSLRIYSGIAYQAYSADELADLVVTDAGEVLRSSGAVFPSGDDNILVEYEHGWDAPPADLKEAALTRLRYRLTAARSAIPDRATSMQTEGGMTFRLDRPDRRKTGIPEVDATYGRYSATSPIF